MLKVEWFAGEKGGTGDGRAVDPHSFFKDPDPAVFLNTDPDTAAFLCESGSS